MFISKRKLMRMERQLQSLNDRVSKCEDKANSNADQIKGIQKTLGEPEDGKHQSVWSLTRMLNTSMFGYGWSGYDLGVEPKELTLWETVNQVIDAAGLEVKKTNAITEVVKVEEPKAPVKRKRKAAKKGKK